MNYNEIISIQPGKRGGRACIRGMRIAVSDVLGWLASGMTLEEIITDFPELTEDDIRACLQYHSDELRLIVRRVVTEIAEMMPSENEVRTELVCDEETGHYQLGQVGWEDGRRVDDVFLHVSVQDCKVWIQHDGTDLPLATMLEKAGIRKDEIVLAFHPPHLRKYTEFAALELLSHTPPPAATPRPGGAAR